MKRNRVKKSVKKSAKKASDLKIVNLRRYRFHIVYDVDAHGSLVSLRPPEFRKRGWRVLESRPTDPAEFDGALTGAKHQSYSGILDFEAFCDFVDHVGLTPEWCKTLGTLGAPGLGAGLSPAVAFGSSCEDAYQLAYVTPVPPDDAPKNVRWADVEHTVWEWFQSSGRDASQRANELEKSNA